MKKIVSVLVTLAMLLGGFAALAEEKVSDGIGGGIDYLALVNKLNPLPEGWEDALKTVVTVNSVGDEVEVEAKAFDAYLGLKADLENKPRNTI